MNAAAPSDAILVKGTWNRGKNIYLKLTIVYAHLLTLNRINDLKYNREVWKLRKLQGDPNAEMKLAETEKRLAYYEKMAKKIEEDSKQIVGDK